MEVWGELSSGVVESFSDPHAQSSRNWQTWLDFPFGGAPEEVFQPVEIATIAAKLDRKQEAVAWLQCAFDERDSWIVYIKVGPKLKNIRRETGVQELIGKLLLP